MLAIDVTLIDMDGRKAVAKIRATRGQQHPKIPRAFYYEYRATVSGKMYTGTILDSFKNGGMGLTVKITKHLLAQIKAERADA